MKEGGYKGSKEAIKEGIGREKSIKEGRKEGMKEGREGEGLMKDRES